MQTMRKNENKNRETSYIQKETVEISKTENLMLTG